MRLLHWSRTVSELTIVFHGHDLKIEVLNYEPGVPAMTSGPPEYCSPAEPPEIEFDYVGYSVSSELLADVLEPYADEIQEIVLRAIKNGALDKE